MPRRSISCSIQDDMLSWWCMHAVAADAPLRNPSTYNRGSARMLCLGHDCLHAVVRRLLDERESRTGAAVERSEILTARRVLRSVAALMCTCITMREVLRAWGPLGAIRLEAMARLGLARRWSTSGRLSAMALQLRFRDYETQRRSSELYALPLYFDEAAEAGSAAMLERAVAMKVPRGSAVGRMRCDCAAQVRSIEGMGAAPFTADSSFDANEHVVSILAGGGAHSSVVAVLEGGGGSSESPGGGGRWDSPGDRRVRVLGARECGAEWSFLLNDAVGDPAPSLVLHDVSSIAVESQGRAVAVVASDRSPELRSVQYMMWVWVWRSEGPPLRHVFVPPSTLRDAGVSNAYMHVQEAWFGAREPAGALRLFVASSPIHMKLRGECMANDDLLTERVEASLGADGTDSADLRSHVEAPAVLALRIDATTGEVALVETTALENSAGAAPIDVAHDERGGIVALLMRVTYAAAGNVGAQCTQLLAERTSTGEHVDATGDIVGPRFVKLLAAHSATNQLHELATHAPYQARRWKEFAHGGPVSVALSPDGRILATGFVRNLAREVHVHLDAIDENGHIVQWRVLTADLPFALSRPVWAATPLVEFSPTGRFVFLRDAAPQIGAVGVLLEVVDLGTYGENATIMLRASREQRGEYVRWVAWWRDGLWIVHGSSLLRCNRKVERAALLDAANFHGAIPP